uniref:Uncharacterized protein n=1 Tax=Craspedostauros australis TaxID=1486917 RepID=A0A6T6HMK5_9STRA
MDCSHQAIALLNKQYIFNRGGRTANLPSRSLAFFGLLISLLDLATRRSCHPVVIHLGDALAHLAPDLRCSFTTAMTNNTHTTCNVAVIHCAPIWSGMKVAIDHV